MNRWMSSNISILGNKDISKLIIPGVGLASGYISQLFQFLNYRKPKDFNVYKLFNRGVRYIEIDVGKYKNKWYVFDGIIPCISLEKVLYGIRKFLAENVEEVIFIRCKFRLKSMEIYSLFQYLSNEISGVTNIRMNKTNIRMNKTNNTLRDMIDNDERVVLFLPNNYRETLTEISAFPSSVINITNTFNQDPLFVNVRLLNIFNIGDIQKCIEKCIENY